MPVTRSRGDFSEAAPSDPPRSEGRTATAAVPTHSASTDLELAPSATSEATGTDASRGSSRTGTTVTTETVTATTSVSEIDALSITTATATTAVRKTPSGTQATGAASARSQISGKPSTGTRKSSKSRKSASNRAEVLRKDVEIAKLRLELEEAIQGRHQPKEPESEEEESEDGSIIGASERVQKWVEDQPVRAPVMTLREEPAPPQRSSSHHEAGQPASKALEAPTERPHASISLDVLTEALREATTSVRTERRPTTGHELPTFNGRCEDWLTFKAAFMESAGYYSDTENTIRLRKSLQGAAKETVSGLLIGHPGPTAVMEALARRFGRPEVLIRAEMDKVKNLPRVSDDTNEICEFANKIANTVAAIEILNKPQYLYNPETIQCIVNKLPPILRDKWYDYREGCDDETPELRLISKFLNREADKRVPYAQMDKPTMRDKVNRHNKFDRAYVISENKCPMCSEQHTLVKCKKFIKASVEKRWDIVKKLKVCFKCVNFRHNRYTCQARPCGYQGCARNHHKLLHDPNAVGAARSPPPAPSPAEGQATIASTREIAVAAQNKQRCAFLKIAPVTISGPRKQINTYALLDEGSTITIINDNIANEIGLDGPIDPMCIQGVSGTEMRHQSSRRVSFTIRDRNGGKKHKIKRAHTVNNLNFTSQTIPTEMLRECKHLQDIVDNLAYSNAVPTILIGQDNWELIVSRSIRQGKRNQPVASRTKLGWVLHGCKTMLNKPIVYCATYKTCEMADMFKKYSDLESLGIESRRPREDPENVAVAMLDERSRRLPSGRFETGLLWKDNITDVPDSYSQALKRLYNLEKKLDQDSDLRMKYEAKIDDLFQSGYAEKAPTVKGRVTWYLPHFCVINPAKPKIRVVYDAAARNGGKCLNDFLLPGPDFLQALPAVLMKFRQYPVAVSADIKEMFLQIRIREDDRDALRFLWRGPNRSGPPTEYRMTSVVFGANSSPCTALYIKNRNAREHSEKYPEATKAIIENHYMDDYLQSFKTPEEAQRVAKDVDHVHRQACFELRGWASNDESTRAKLSCQETEIRIGGSEMEKALGLLWDTSTDTITFRWNNRGVDISEIQTPTKRQALSAIMSIFDPLGVLSPITTPGKRVFQDSWKYSTGWDEPLPSELLNRWREWLTHMASLEALRIPRCYESVATVEYELHTFVDASEEAYAAAVYWRMTCADGSVKIALAMAKSRVTPTKIVSVPRLELQAAVIGVRLCKSVMEGHDYTYKTKTYWSDSRTTLTWIRSEPRTYKSFVAHRLAEIEDETKKDEWRWVPTAHNVADDATRNTPPHFTDSHRWYRGPEFLYHHHSTWPVERKEHVRDTGEERPIVEKCMHTMTSDKCLPDVNRFSSWLKLIRSTARMLQFVDICKQKKESSKIAVLHKRTKANKENDPEWNAKQVQPAKQKESFTTEHKRYLPLGASYVNKAITLWIVTSQRIAFAETVTRLKSEKVNTELTTDSDKRLAYLSVYLDSENVLRVKSRIYNAADIETSMSSPYVLCSKDKYTRLYILHVHQRLHHGSTELVVNELRQELYMSKIRPTVKAVIRSCQRCRIEKARPARPSTGDLPQARLAHHVRPFTYTGVDYFGPLEVTVGRHHEKRYVALFTCLTARAVHLEVVHSLSAASCISALRRFIARRGTPAEIHSDNATCFRAADKELAEAVTAALADEAASHRITWRFMPPAAPFMAGAWERMVRTVKTALRVTLRERYPSDETLATLLAEVEATVNSRPLTHVGVAADDPAALTPNLLLLGPSCSTLSPGVFTEEDEAARAHWRRAQRLADLFWSRWVREYLPLLQHRREPCSSGVAPKVGDLVVVCDPNQPRNVWPRGRVTRVFPGPDNTVRVVDIETSSGNILRRPTKRLAVLPVDGCGHNGGRNVPDGAPQA